MLDFKCLLLYRKRMKEKLLLHVCCAPCLTYPFFVLKDKYEVFAFFSNSNISDFNEYKLRLKEFENFCEINNIEYYVDNYEKEKWLSAIKDLEKEPEKIGKRCSVCFNFRLSKCFSFAEEKGIKFVATTLTVSPYKDFASIEKVGKRLERLYDGVKFLDNNFKKNDGFKKSKQISKEYNLYMQNYCGCEFSKR
jgi:epoxyqueuosine reductase